ncbi:hypothetical protein Mapa_012737 [Marchantia paleacea]|nr:hypothetical protein Mapa_012737 [Marchantia paleacea]
MREFYSSTNTLGKLFRFSILVPYASSLCVRLTVDTTEMRTLVRVGCSYLNKHRLPSKSSIKPRCSCTDMMLRI